MPTFVGIYNTKEIYRFMGANKQHLKHLVDFMNGNKDFKDQKVPEFKQTVSPNKSIFSTEMLLAVIGLIYIFYYFKK
jgi:hypothetical protein